MKPSSLFAVFLGLAVCLCWAGIRPAPADPPQFDNLTDKERDAFAERFEREIWPLMTRNGKDGCVGCHSSAGTVSALRFAGSARKDFAMLLKEGFLLPDDPGSLLARITERDEERRMPYGKKPWAEKDVQVLREFLGALHGKNKGK
jgi:hypothetical protein